MLVKQGAIIAIRGPNWPAPVSIHFHHNFLHMHMGVTSTFILEAPDRDAAASEPRELTAGGPSFVATLIIATHLPPREVWHIFITLVIKAIADYYQDIKLTRHLNELMAQCDDSLEWSRALHRHFGRILSKRHPSFYEQCNYAIMFSV